MFKRDINKIMKMIKREANRVINSNSKEMQEYSKKLEDAARFKEKVEDALRSAYPTDADKTMLVNIETAKKRKSSSTVSIKLEMNLNAGIILDFVKSMGELEKAKLASITVLDAKLNSK